MPFDMVSPSLAYSKLTDESTNSYSPSDTPSAVVNNILNTGERVIPPDQIAEQLNIHNSLKATFIPLPSDPCQRLTPEQLDALFPTANRAIFVRELLRLGIAAQEVKNEANSGG